MFDKNLNIQLDKCKCCFSCIKTHSESGCQVCRYFLETYFPRNNSVKGKKSVYAELKHALTELFEAMNVKSLRVEADLEIDCSSFICDFLRVVDQVKSFEDIEKLWHVERKVAINVFSIFDDVLHDNFDEVDGEDENEEEEIQDDEFEDDFWSDSCSNDTVQSEFSSDLSEEE